MRRFGAPSPPMMKAGSGTADLPGLLRSAPRDRLGAVRCLTPTATRHRASATRGIAGRLGGSKLRKRPATSCRCPLPPCPASPLGPIPRSLTTGRAGALAGEMRAHACGCRAHKRASVRVSAHAAPRASARAGVCASQRTSGRTCSQRACSPACKRASGRTGESACVQPRVPACGRAGVRASARSGARP